VTLIRRPLILLGPAVVLVAALALATNVLPLRQLVAQRQQIADTRATLDELMQENARLDTKVEALDTPVEVERIAREELGFVRPGETAFVVIDPATPEQIPGAAAVTPRSAPQDRAVSSTPAADIDAVDDRGVVARVWDYMTGRDLVDAR
jgi:cell division protein FtsB